MFEVKFGCDPLANNVFNQEDWVLTLDPFLISKTNYDYSVVVDSFQGVHINDQKW